MAVEMKSEQQFASLLSSSSQVLVVAYFWADFHEACKPGGQMDQVVTAFQSKFAQSAVFAKLEAESLSSVAEKYGVTMVPAFVIFKHGNKIDSCEGVKPQDLASKIEKHIRELSSKTSGAAEVGAKAQPEGLDNALKQRMDTLIGSSKIMLFMKGNANEPKCKFSRAMVEILNEESISFASFDILTDNSVREGLKVYKNWKTFPQLYASGKLVGGLDSVKDLRAKGPLKDMLQAFGDSPDSAVNGSPNSDVAALVGKKAAVVVMEGSAQEAKGDTATMMEILKNQGIAFDTVDIVSQPQQTRSAMEKNWPTFPQLYANGMFYGGLGMLQQALSSGAHLPAMFGQEKLEDRLKRLVNLAPVTLFMKGIPEAPRCGFSRTMVGILQQEGIEFKHFDILTDESVRQGLKTFSNWPTYPQLYSKGTLIGGLDIVRELHDDGELQEALQS